ncbi:unnamed protein product [Adineta steineri]|uniref:Dynamin-type G domain-containing protein n=1 Tax=Adineta steineri TaxID=433720 RepID=A0A814IP47_9BILA|nr:unnamed protein product [Adineta steineri]CAF1119955.1 unnamed protein product [Adineta steineri]
MMDSFVSAYDGKVGPLMDKIDQVRALLSANNDGVNFPNVVVVGDQSSGKSTLLESLSLVELPKGSGIVTRCPLVLRLRKSIQRKVYRLHDDNKKQFLDETKLNILKYIEEETKILAGNNKNVVENLIELLVEDPNLRDLTVVDLPGIARNPIGDQPKNIHEQTTKLIRNFIKKEGTVILCVFPANVDIATVESFTLAREYDPTGIRTIGVITKSDLAPNQDSLVQQLLMNQPNVFQLTLGFIAVRNRSTDEKISLTDAHTREKEFFSNHPASSLVGWHCLGINALINRLADLYSDRVSEIFPKMRIEVHMKLKDIREQLSKFPPDLDTPSARLAKYHELAEFYVENILKVRFSASVDGQTTSMSNTLHIKFGKYINVIHRHTEELFTDTYHKKVSTAISACIGEQLPNFLPHPVLKRLICEKLDQLWTTTKVLINDCFRTVLNLLKYNSNNQYKDDILLMKLMPAFRDIVKLYLNEKNQIIHNQLHEMIRLEKHDPYTIDSFYNNKIDGFRIYSAELNSKDNDEERKALSLKRKYDDVDDELMFNSILNVDQAVQEMIYSVYSYWKLLTKRFMDYTALTLRAACDFDVCPGVQERLRHLPIEQCDFVDSYLAEDVFTKTKRKQLQQTKERLEKVDAILGGHNTTNFANHTFIDSISMEDDSFMTLDKLAQSITPPPPPRPPITTTSDTITTMSSVPLVPKPVVSNGLQTTSIRK